MRKFLKNFADDKRGGLALVGAITAGTMATAVGIATDHSRSTSAVNKLQNALDSAVLSVANSKDGSIANGKEVFARNVEDAKIANENVTITPSSNGRYLGEATAEVPMYFSSLIGRSKQTITVTSSAKKGTAASQMCILALDDGCGANIVLNGGAKISSPVCEVHAYSHHSYTSIINSNVDLDIPKVCIKAEKMVNNYRGSTPIEMQCQTTTDPFAAVVPQPNPGSCDYRSKNFKGSSLTLNPGTYCGGFNFNSANLNVTFNPGTYILKRSRWNVNGGDWSGDGVTFYFADKKSKIQFNSGVKAELKAPEDGPFAGFVMTEKKGLRQSNFIFNDSRGFNAEGAIYLPSRNVTMNGRSNLTGRKMSLVVNSLRMNSTTLDILPFDADPGSEGNTGYASLEQ